MSLRIYDLSHIFIGRNYRNSLTYGLKNTSMKQIGKTPLTKIAVIGAGQIGPDIALHFSKSLSSFGISVIVLDISPEALEKAKAKVYKKIQKGVEVGTFKPEQAEKMKSAMIFSADYENIRGS